MLQSISIKNYALFADVEIEFGRGLNMLTGETGAGKSILMAALGTILGARVDTTVVRDGAPKAIVEGEFAVNGHQPLYGFLTSQELSAENEPLILRREIHQGGRSRAFVNDSPVPLSTLQKIGDFLVDLHGQHEHQSLLKVHSHLNFVDGFGGLKDEKKACAKLFRSLQALNEKLDQLVRQEAALKDKRESYAFQINEIDKLAPVPEEELNLQREEKILRNSELLYNLTDELHNVLYESENAVFDRMNRVRRGLEELEGIDNSFADHREGFESATVAVEELAKVLQQYRSNISFDANRLEEVQNRMAQLAGLKKKFGLSLTEMLEFQTKMQSELDNLENLDAQISAIKERIKSENGRFSEVCLVLSRQRRKVADQLERLVPEVLAVLGMPEVRFKVTLEYAEATAGIVTLDGKSYQASESGMDLAEFWISPNKGEDLRPLAKVASGGEISRIMLALKSIAAREEQIPVLVFDEIDIGVSGRVAQAVGRKLKALASRHQVICVTHLPQIASMGQHHYAVEKTEKADRTITLIRRLSTEERTEAVAKLLAGERVSEAHLSSARELLADASLN